MTSINESWTFACALPHPRPNNRRSIRHFHRQMRGGITSANSLALVCSGWVDPTHPVLTILQRNDASSSMPGSLAPDRDALTSAAVAPIHGRLVCNKSSSERQRCDRRGEITNSYLWLLMCHGTGPEFESSQSSESFGFRVLQQKPSREFTTTATLPTRPHRKADRPWLQIPSTRVRIGALVLSSDTLVLLCFQCSVSTTGRKSRYISPQIGSRGLAGDSPGRYWRIAFRRCR